MKIIKNFLIFLFIIFFCIISWSIFIQLHSTSRSYDNVESIPFRSIGLVLGTNPLQPDNHQPNLYFLERINATLELYKAGKIKTILASGDGISRANYNEPISMKNALISNGIPESDIILDTYGIDTRTSLFRAKQMYNDHSITIISQSFHTARALFIGDQLGLDLIAYQARDDKWYTSVKTYIREAFARIKMIFF